MCLFLLFFVFHYLLSTSASIKQQRTTKQMELFASLQGQIPCNATSDGSTSVLMTFNWWRVPQNMALHSWDDVEGMALPNQRLYCRNDWHLVYPSLLRDQCTKLPLPRGFYFAVDAEIVGKPSGGDLGSLVKSNEALDALLLLYRWIRLAFGVSVPAEGPIHQIATSKGFLLRCWCGNCWKPLRWCLMLFGLEQWGFGCPIVALSMELTVVGDGHGVLFFCVWLVSCTSLTWDK